MLLVIIFEMASHDSESNHDHDNDNDGNYSSLCHNYDATTTTDDDTHWSPNIINGSFINVLSIATMIIVTSLLGLIASYSPDYNNNHDNDNDNNDSNPNSAFCCSCSFKQCLRRNNRNNAWQLPTHVTPNGDTYVPDEGGDDVDSHGNGTSDNTTPLLINDYLRNEQESTLGSLDTNESEHVISDDGIVHETRGDAQLESRIAGSRRLLKLAGPHAFYLFIGCLVLLVRLPFSLSIPHFVSVTLGALAKAEYETAKMSILFLFLFGTIDAILDFFCVFLFGLANLKIAKSVRIELFMKILGQEMGFFDKNKSGDLASRLNSDCGEMASDLTWFFRFSIESIVRIVGIVLYMFLRAPKLAICAVSVVPIVAIMNKRYSTWLSKNARDVQTALANANSIAQEALMNIRCVVAFGSEHVEKRKYKGKVDEHYKLNVKQLYATGFYYMLISTFLINTCVQALLLYVGMDLISNNQIQSEVLLAFMLYQSQLQNEVMNLFNSFTSLIKSSGAGDKVFELLDR
jgi:ATP-binding cassette subfamily B (MDR/TAP) protein 9